MAGNSDAAAGRLLELVATSGLIFSSPLHKGVPAQALSVQPGPGLIVDDLCVGPGRAVPVLVVIVHDEPFHLFGVSFAPAAGLNAVYNRK
jgi:hypothetical protein